MKREKGCGLSGETRSKRKNSIRMEDGPEGNAPQSLRRDGQWGAARSFAARDGLPKKKKKNPLSLSIVVFPTSLFPFSSVLSHSKCIHKSYTINASSRAAELNQRKQTLFSGSSSILREGLTFRKADSLGEK